MDGISSALATQQAMTQNLISLEVFKMAMQSQQQVIALLDQATSAALASNPAHLGQSIDTFA
jgi:hypothetical protein